MIDIEYALTAATLSSQDAACGRQELRTYISRLMLNLFFGRLTLC